MIRVTRNDLKNMGKRCIRLPYADPVTRYLPKIGYNAGAYGWNWSAYTMDGFIIIAGYRSLPSWAIVPTSRELEELHKAYQSGNHELLGELLGKIRGLYENGGVECN